MPLQSKHGAVPTDDDEHGRIGIVTKLLHEPETGIEHRGSCDVTDIQHGFDALDHCRHAESLTAIKSSGGTDAQTGAGMRAAVFEELERIPDNQLTATTS